MLKPWTGPEQKRLVELYKRFSIEGCAMVMDRSYASVKGMIQSMGLKSVHNTSGNTRVFFADSVAAIFELMGMGFSHLQISQCFRVSTTTIRTTIERAEREGFDAYPKRTL